LVTGYDDVLANLADSTDEVLAGRVRHAINVFYNYSGQLEKACIYPVKCGGLTPETGKLALGFAWFYQYCTEITLGKLFRTNTVRRAWGN
jgi:hypothetical protein